jgi:Zn-dependent peptidase ImmA (M78 family)
MKSAQKILDAHTEEIINKLSTDLSGYYSKYSLDIDAVCRKYGIKLLEAEFPNELSGTLIKENGNWTIAVNSLHPPVRRRFTIAHELGHFFAILHDSEIAKEYLERNDDVIKDNISINRAEIDSDAEDYQVERQANHIAASILMPEEKVMALYKEGHDISDMANSFGVSESAMSFRLKGLNIESIELIS